MKSNPFAPAKYAVADAAALKALQAGNASPDQQRRGLMWIVNAAAMTYDETFVPGQTDLGHYLAGRRNVGLQIVKLLNVPIEQLKKD